MTWRVRVKHRTGYSYEGEVRSSYNEARMTPLTDSTQTTLESRLEISPSAHTFRYHDYWGTYVTAFDLHNPHTELVVTATSVVETNLREVVSGGLGWHDLHSDQVADRQAEWLEQTPRTDPDGELAEFARSVAASLAPADAAIACLDAVLEHMEYVPGATGVHTTGLEAWMSREGVCQDFAHVSLAMLRSLGIPARYVSGYLHPKATAEISETVAGESHAWVEFWDGAWVGHDPTNKQQIGEQHVVVARGRDYADVTPLKGIFSGPKSSALGVTVEVTRLA